MEWSQIDQLYDRQIVVFDLDDAKKIEPLLLKIKNQGFVLLNAIFHKGQTTKIIDVDKTIGRIPQWPLFDRVQITARFIKG